MTHRERERDNGGAQEELVTEFWLRHRELVEHAKTLFTVQLSVGVHLNSIVNKIPITNASHVHSGHMLQR